MLHRHLLGLLCLCLGASLRVGADAGTSGGSSPVPLDLFQRHCAECHGPDRLGRVGPALLPENLGRLTREQAADTIRNGRPATQMPAFGERLSAAEIESLVGLVYSPLAEVPVWDMEQIGASRLNPVDQAGLPAQPVFAADPLNLFVVVELGDHHATILDGDRLEPIHRFATRFALHGGPKFSPDGRFVYLASRDGWVSKFDLYSLQTVAEARAGINTRNLAVSSDGRYVMVANTLPHSLVLLSAADLTPIKVIPVQDDGGKSSRVSAVYDAAPRSSFVAALKDIPEVWEIQYRDDPIPVYNGPMHDYALGEGLARQQGPFPVRRIRLDDYLDDFSFDPGYHLILGASRDDHPGQVVHLDLGRKIADLDLDGMPHLASGITWDYQGRPVLATPHLKKGEVSVIDLTDFHTVKRIETLGPGFFMRSHEASPYAWVDASVSPYKDSVQVIDKASLAIVRTLRPAPGKTAAHVEFDRYGKYALLSIAEPSPDGALIVYDAQTLEEVKRLPMNRPSGKYNVYNKVTRSAGTSH